MGRFAQIKGCSLDHLVKVMVPDMTNELLFCMLNPEVCERIEESVVAGLPAELRETVLRQRAELNLKLREYQQDPN